MPEAAQKRKAQGARHKTQGARPEALGAHLQEMSSFLFPLAEGQLDSHFFSLLSMVAQARGTVLYIRGCFSFILSFRLQDAASTQ